MQIKSKDTSSRRKSAKSNSTKSLWRYAKGDHEQAQNLHGMQIELDLQASLCLSRSFKKAILASRLLMDVTTILIISSILGIIKMLAEMR